ncbi:MAG: hypothetical protein J2P57_13260 [Acidimicrobiaceae bacterium]|nr:hypothetical protein [Acidimicrobiaceae bacterium]
MPAAGQVADPSFSGRAAVARRDITPPVGIYARNWGAAPHDVASGVHRPLLATVLALAPEQGGPVVLASLDLGWWRSPDDEIALRRALLDRLGLPDSALLVALSHSHSGPSICSQDAQLPGGGLVKPYLEWLAAEVGEACVEAVSNLQPATLAVAAGSCRLATNRDLVHEGRHLCGFNPGEDADDTLLVGRVTSRTGETLATIVNYACHPTTLALENRLLSPDFVGAMREVVESGGAPCLFLQGASGELGPREGFTSDVSIADSHGRVLGHSVRAILEGMLPPATELEFERAVESGATLGLWGRRARTVDGTIDVTMTTVKLPRSSGAASDWGDLEPRVRDERMRRRQRIEALLSGDAIPVPLWVWRLGEILLVATPNELYSLFQRELRRRLDTRPVLVASIVNGPYLGYLPDEQAFEGGYETYQVWQSPFDKGALEELIETASRILLTV